MIRSVEDYKEYLKQDARALGLTDTVENRILRALGLRHEIWKFQRLLRKTEYLTNCEKSFLRIGLCKVRYRRLSMKLGFSIPVNTFGPGLSIAHRGDIIVNGAARIGANCRIHVGVNIGTSAGTKDSAPTIGENCYIGPGAKLFGPIKIADDIAIGANSVVNKSFLDGDLTIGGVPAKIISSTGSKKFLIV